MVRRSTCVSSIALGVISRPPRLMRHDGPETQDRQRSKRCHTGCLYRETIVAGERLLPTRLMAIAKELRDLFIPSKAIEFPGVLDLIKGKQPAQAGIFAPLDIDEAEGGDTVAQLTSSHSGPFFRIANGTLSLLPTPLAPAGEQSGRRQSAPAGNHLRGG